MTNQATQKFFRRHPGPFDYSTSHNGVRDCHSVYCTTSHEPLMTDYYRDDECDAELVAKSICFALNMLSSGEPQLWENASLPTEIQWLLSRYPGPFGATSSGCEFMPYFKISCLRTKRLVFHNYAFEDEQWGRTIAEVAATALNALRKPRLIDRPLLLLATL